MGTLEALSLFLLLISSSVFLVPGSPAHESVDNATISDDVNSTRISTATPVTTASSTVAPPTTTVSQDIEGKDKVVPEEDPSSDSKPDKKPKEKSAGLLLYEVEKGISNLSLEAVEYVLQMGDEVFSYSLADKLGYIKDGQVNDNDPHLKVMDESKEILVKKLEDRKNDLKPIVKVPPPTTKPVTSPPPPETSPPTDEGRIKYGIVKKIMKLTIKDIDQMIRTYDVDTLPYALGHELGYDEERDAEYFQYLKAKGGEKLKGILMNEKKRKLNEPHPKSPQDTQPQSNGDDTGLNRQPDGGGGKMVDEVNRGSKEEDGGNDLNNDRPSLSPVGVEHVDYGDGNDDEQAENSLNMGDGLTIANKNANNEDQSIADKDIANSEIPPPLKDLAGDDRDGEGTRRPEGKPKDGDTEQGGGDHKNDSGNPKGGEKKGGDPAEGEDQNKKEGVELHDIAEDEDEEMAIGRSGFSFGAWHFLTIFILIGVAVIVGYLCLHNRKKLREGVGTYISDSNKRRRRAREYKPLVST